MIELSYLRIIPCMCTYVHLGCTLHVCVRDERQDIKDEGFYGKAKELRTMSYVKAFG